MAKKKTTRASSKSDATNNASSSVDELLLAALEKGGETLETGRYLVTFKEGSSEEGMEHLNSLGLRIADARDFDNQAITPESIGDADSIVFPEIGVALISGG